MQPASAKAKGRRCQQQVAKDILELFPQLTKDDVRSTSMGVTGADIQLSQAAKGVFPYQVECKAKAKSPVHTLYEQAKTHGDLEPLVLVKKDRDVILAIVSWEHLQKLIKELSANRH